MRLQRFLAVFIGRNLEFIRDRSAFGWNIAFPVFIVLGFAFAFSGDKLDLYKVGLYGDESEAQNHRLEFLQTDYIQFIPIADLAEAITKVERHQLDMMLDPSTRRYWINDSSPRGYVLERVLAGTSGKSFHRETVSGQEVRYVDWLIPGVLGMNMMFSALFGVGYVIVRYRKNGVLKRLKATPLSPLEFLAAQVLSRLWLIVLVTTAVFIGTNLIVDFTMHGSYLNLVLVLILGAASLISLGLLVAARIASEETANGLLNAVSWPMMFLSGVWFSLEGLHPLLQKLAQVFPLTHAIDSARAIMIDGAGLAEISGHLIIMVLMTGTFLALGSLSFRWE
jgi:ABC-type multidrug transport system permease subunit